MIAEKLWDIIKFIAELVWDIIKFITELVWDILSTIFTFIINIFFSVLDQVVKFYFNIINTIFNDYPSVFIITLIIICSIYIYKVKNYKLNDFLNKKVILNTLAIFFMLIPLMTFFIGSITNYLTSIMPLKSKTAIQ